MANMIEDVWRIGASPSEKDALIVPTVRSAKIEALGSELARLPLSFTKSGGGVKRAPTGSRGYSVTLTIPKTFAAQHISGHGPFYLWMTAKDGERIADEWCNQFLIARRENGLDEQEVPYVSINFQSQYKREFSSTDELLAATRARPSGDFVNADCGCRGQHDGLRDWLRRVTRRAPYIYALSVVEGSEIQYHDQVNTRPPRFVVSRVARDGTVDWQCSCGAWTEVEPHNRGLEGMTLLEFYDSRSAQDHMRRLRNGVPQNWELIVAVASIVSGAAFVIGEIVIPLVSSCE